MSFSSFLSENITFYDKNSCSRLQLQQHLPSALCTLQVCRVLQLLEKRLGPLVSVSPPHSASRSPTGTFLGCYWIGILAGRSTALDGRAFFRWKITAGLLSVRPGSHSCVPTDTDLLGSYACFLRSGYAFWSQCIMEFLRWSYPSLGNQCVSRPRRFSSYANSMTQPRSCTSDSSHRESLRKAGRI